MGHPSVKNLPIVQDVSIATCHGFLRAMSQAADVGSVVLLHCEDAAIMGCCADRLQDQGLTEHRHYPETRPVEAERIATERAVGYCETTGAASYIVHLSSQAALQACRTARARGLPLYVETRPIYLHLERSRFDEPDGAKYAGAPPSARRRRPRRALGRDCRLAPLAPLPLTMLRGRSNRSSTRPSAHTSFAKGWLSWRRSCRCCGRLASRPVECRSAASSR